MKVIEQTPRRLILRGQDVIFGLILTAIALGGFAFCVSLILDGVEEGWLGAIACTPLIVFSIFVAGTKRELIGDRDTQTISLVDVSIRKRTSVAHPLSEIGGAYIHRTNRYRGGISTLLFEPMLQLTSGMDKGDHSIAFLLNEEAEAQRIVDAVNDWLNMA